MTTEVQIGRNASHLHLLRKVVSRTARTACWLGMSRKAIQETEDAVSQACIAAMGESADDLNTLIKVSVSADSTGVQVDITNPLSGYLPLTTAEYADDGLGTMAQIGRLVDSVELISGENCSTIRIVKRARKIDTTPAIAAAYLTKSLQS